MTAIDEALLLTTISNSKNILQQDMAYIVWLCEKTSEVENGFAYKAE